MRTVFFSFAHIIFAHSADARAKRFLPVAHFYNFVTLPLFLSLAYTSVIACEAREFLCLLFNFLLALSLSCHLFLLLLLPLAIVVVGAATYWGFCFSLSHVWSFVFLVGLALFCFVWFHSYGVCWVLVPFLFLGRNYANRFPFTIDRVCWCVCVCVAVHVRDLYGNWRKIRPKTEFKSPVSYVQRLPFLHSHFPSTDTHMCVAYAFWRSIDHSYFRNHPFKSFTCVAFNTIFIIYKNRISCLNEKKIQLYFVVSKTNHKSWVIRKMHS